MALARLRHTGARMQPPPPSLPPTHPPPAPAPRRPLRRALGWLLAAPILLVVVVLSLVLQGEPSVADQARLSGADVTRALALLRAHDPRRAEPGRVKALSLSAREVELLVNHAGQRWATGAGRVSIYQGGATVALSLHTPRWLPGWVNAVSPFGAWLNAELRLVQTAGLPALDGVSVGRLPVPVWLAQPLALRVLAAAGLADELPLLAELVQRVRLRPDRVTLVYAWQSGMGERMLAALVPGDDKRRMQAYAERLADVLMQQRPAWQVSMARLLGPLLDLARQRTAAGEDAAAENRAAIVVLAMYLNGRGLKAVLPAGSVPPLRPMRVLLGTRDDWPLHFIVSAALATESSGPVSRAIGLFKEVADARSGSGFSFNDMAANRAGTRFGERAVKQPQALQAALFAAAQARPEKAVAEEDFMPEATDLPEFMPEADFVRRFGGIGAPAYEQQMAEIERRVASLAFLRGGDR